MTGAFLPLLLACCATGAAGIEVDDGPPSRPDRLPQWVGDRYGKVDHRFPPPASQKRRRKARRAGRYRSEIPALGDHRALLIGQGRARACLSRHGETWALTSSRGTVTGALADVLGGWPMPWTVAWVAGGQG